MSRPLGIIRFLSPITILLVFTWVGDVNSFEYSLGNPFGMGPWQRLPFGLPPMPPFVQQLYYPNWGFQPSFFPQLPAVIVSQVEQVMDYLYDATDLDPDNTEEDDDEYETDEEDDDDEEEEEEVTTTTTTTTTKKPTTPKKKRPKGK